MFANVAGTPFAYIDYYHVPPQLYGLLFGASIVGIIVTNFINARLVMHFGCTRLLQMGTAGATLVGIVLAMDARTGCAWLFVPKPPR